MTWKGFKFGILLQLAVGPMCLFVFSTATKQGFVIAFSLVLAIALIDACYITLAGFGITALLGKQKVKHMIKVLGGCVLILFGLQTILGVFDLTILPDIIQINHDTYHNLFLQGLILTASNPLTIIFWSGVFSAQVIENKLTNKQLISYGFGCVLSTLIFMSCVAVLGSFVSRFLPETILQILNSLVGLLIIYFGIRLFVRKE